jgi:PAS domain S-box-containing protein
VRLVQELLRAKTWQEPSRAPVAQLLLGLAGLALITVVSFHFGFGIARTGFAFVIALALVSLLGSFIASIVLSVVAAACLNYFFASPLFEFRIDIPDDIERIAVFLTTSVVVTVLTTRLKRSGDELRKNQANWSKAEIIAHFGWWERDFITRHLAISDEVSRIFGIRPIDLPHWYGRWLELIHPEDRAQVADAAAAALHPGGPRFDVEYRIVRPDGTLRVIHSQGDVTWGKSGQPLRQFGVLHDVTELRQAERELRVSEARFRTFVDHATDGYFLLNDQSIVIDVNQQACDALGYGRSELIGKHRGDFDVGLGDASINGLNQSLVTGQRIAFETIHRRKDGSSFPVEVRIGHFEQGGHRFLCVARDITERRKAEEALRRSAAYLAEAQRLSRTGTSVFDASGDLYWSEECYRIWELDPSQGLPDAGTVLQRVHPDDRERVSEQIRRDLRQKREQVLEFRIIGSNGAIKHIETIYHPLLSVQGDVVEVIATHVDVSERRRAQEQAERLRQLESDLAHMQRLALMGELTASLAHEILHPIATARNNARAGMRILESHPQDTDQVREALACVVRDADRARDIIGRIRDHIKRAPPKNEIFDINEAVDEVIAMVRSSIEKSVTSVRTRFAEQKAFVRGDRVQLQQVTLNLILNAVEAMASVKDGARELSVSTEAIETGGTLVRVSDSGPGIEPEHVDRIFEPFYTTRRSGIGMGLSICRSIVNAHGGRLWTQAGQPRGAVFQFTLPAADEIPQDISSATRDGGEPRLVPDDSRVGFE